MNAGEFRGRLIVDPDPSGASQHMQPGDYVHLVYVGQDGKSYDYWCARTPNGEPAALGGHQITEHDDGTITVSPSIEVSLTCKGQKVVLYHGFLERGVWRSA